MSLLGDKPRKVIWVGPIRYHSRGKEKNKRKKEKKLRILIERAIG